MKYWAPDVTVLEVTYEALPQLALQVPSPHLPPLSPTPLLSTPDVHRPEEGCDARLDPARLHRLLLPHRDCRPCGRLPGHLSAPIVGAGQVQQVLHPDLHPDDPGGEAASNR